MIMPYLKLILCILELFQLCLINLDRLDSIFAGADYLSYRLKFCC